MAGPLSLELVDAQEARFAAAFGAGDITMAQALYRPDVFYVSPTTRACSDGRRASSGSTRPSSSSSSRSPACPTSPTPSRSGR